MPFARHFSMDTSTMTSEVKVSDKRAMKIDYISQPCDLLAFTIHGPGWTLPRRVNWIDRGIKHEDVTRSAVRNFVHHALEAVMGRKT